jgi:glycosyltransferase involved in cell wall biosynthesis
MLHPGALAQKKWKKKIYLQLFKLLEYHYKVDFHATDEEEANYIRNYFNEPAKVFVAGNFPNKLSLLPVADKEVGKLKLVTVAIISPMKNILLVLEALEKLADDIQYDIYGPVKDEEYWDACKEQIKKLPQNIKVLYHKEIAPQKVREVLRSTHVFILPSKSENFGHALYEALSAGRPVITSRNTPWNDLQESKAGMNVSVDFAIEITEAVHFFAQRTGEEMEKWSREAAAYSASKVDEEEIRRAYGRMFVGM